MWFAACVVPHKNSRVRRWTSATVRDDRVQAWKRSLNTDCHNRGPWSQSIRDWWPKTLLTASAAPTAVSCVFNRHWALSARWSMAAFVPCISLATSCESWIAICSQAPSNMSVGSSLCGAADVKVVKHFTTSWRLSSGGQCFDGELSCVAGKWTFQRWSPSAGSTCTSQSRMFP